MDWKQLFFTFQGRTNRSKFWLAALIFLFICAVLATSSVASSIALSGHAVTIIGIVNSIVFLLAAVAVAAVCIKRLHDRGKSGWWLALFWLAPSVLMGLAQPTSSPTLTMILALAAVGISSWGGIELGFLRGTVGDNQYGADPLAKN